VKHWTPNASATGTSALQQLELPFADCAPLNWLESGHD
jgi:hypothetical protein